MPSWLTTRPPSSSSPWSEKLDLPSYATHSRSAHTTPATSTMVDQQSLPTPVVQHTPDSYRSHPHRTVPTLRTLSWHWQQFKERLRPAAAPPDGLLVKSESLHDDDVDSRMADLDSANDGVDEVVVDRAWSEDLKSSASYSENPLSPEKSSATPQLHPPDARSDIYVFEKWSFYTPLLFLRFRAWPLVLKIFSSRFASDEVENAYSQVRRLACSVIDADSVFPRRIGTSESPLRSGQHSGLLSTGS